MQWRAWCAANFRRRCFEEYYADYLQNAVKEEGRPHEERQSRYTKLWKKVMRDLNFLGMSDDCAFKSLGYFRYVCSRDKACTNYKRTQHVLTCATAMQVFFFLPVACGTPPSAWYFEGFLAVLVA